MNRLYVASQSEPQEGYLKFEQAFDPESGHWAPDTLCDAPFEEVRLFRVFEEMDDQVLRKNLELLFGSMAPGGILRISALDLDFVMRLYSEGKVGYSDVSRWIYYGPSGRVQRRGFDRDEIIAILRSVGFEDVRDDREKPWHHEIALRARKPFSPSLDLTPKSWSGVRVVVSTDFYEHHSPGILADEIIRTLDRHDFGVVGLHDFYSENVPHLEDALARRVAVRIEPEPNDILLRIGNLQSVEEAIPSDFPRKWGYFFHELSAVPPSWVARLSEFEQVFFVSNFCAEAAREAGYRGPSKVMHHGIDLSLFHPSKEELQNKKDFVFLTSARQSKRKGIFELVEAFKMAFDTQEHVRLFIHDAEPVPCGYEKNFGDARIALSSGPVSRKEVADFYRSADCFVMPSYVEGFGMPLLEAKACRLPVVTTRFGGQVDFCREDDTYFVEHTLTPSDYLAIPEVISQWAIPDVASLAVILRHIYENPDERREKAERGYRRARMMTWGNVLYPLLRDLGG